MKSKSTHRHTFNHSAFMPSPPPTPTARYADTHRPIYTEKHTFNTKLYIYVCMYVCICPVRFVPYLREVLWLQPDVLKILQRCPGDVSSAVIGTPVLRLKDECPICLHEFICMYVCMYLLFITKAPEGKHNCTPKRNRHIHVHSQNTYTTRTPTYFP
jgi:hypothetical protein